MLSHPAKPAQLHASNQALRDVKEKTPEQTQNGFSALAVYPETQNAKAR